MEVSPRSGRIRCGLTSVTFGGFGAALPILVCLMLGFGAMAQTATITGSIEDCTGVSYTPTAKVRFIPLSTPLQDISNGRTILDQPRSASITNGSFVAYLEGGRYNADFGAPNKLIQILVPPGGGSYTFNQCAQWATNVGTFIWTNTYGLLNNQSTSPVPTNAAWSAGASDARYALAGSSGGTPNAVVTNDARAVALTNAANRFAGSGSGLTGIGTNSLDANFNAIVSRSIDISLPGWAANADWTVPSIPAGAIIWTNGIPGSILLFATNGNTTALEIRGTQGAITFGDNPGSVGNPGISLQSWISMDANHGIATLPQTAAYYSMFGLGIDVPYGIIMSGGNFPLAHFANLNGWYPTNSAYPQGWPDFLYTASYQGFGGNLTLANMDANNWQPLLQLDSLGPLSHGTNGVLARYGFWSMPDGLHIGVVSNVLTTKDLYSGMTVNPDASITFNGHFSLIDPVNGGLTFSINDSGDLILSSGLIAESFVTADAGVVIGSGGIVQAQHFKVLTSRTASSQALTNDLTFVTASGQTMTLPIANGSAGYHYTVKLLASGSCTVASAGGTIDGASTYALSAQWKYVTVTSDGLNWLVIGNN